MTKTEINIYRDRGVYACEMLDKYCEKNSDKIVSDIGAGFGHMKEKVVSLGAEWQPFDYIKKIDETIIWDLNNKTPEIAKKADIVLFLEVLEHLDNPFLGIQNIAGHLKDNGILILTTPNPQSSKNTLSLFLRGSLYAFQEKHINENHVFTPWKHVVYDFLKRSGFEVLEYVIVDMHYKSKKSNSVKDWVKIKIEDFIEYRNPMSKGMSYGLVARKMKL